MFEPQKRDKALAAERQVEAPGERFVAVKSEAHAVARFHVTKREIAARSRYRSRIDEHCTVERPPRLPAVLGPRDHAVLVAESELPETAQCLRASERREEVKGDA